MSLDSNNSPGLSHPGPSSPPVIRNDLTTALQNLTSRHDQDHIPYDTDLPYLDKGKARDTPPTLPPLAFPPITFDICPSSPSLISEPGPSSYGSLHPQHLERDSFSYTPPVLRNSTAHGAAHILPPVSPRRRSSSNPPFRHLERLISSSVHTRVNVESSRSLNDHSHIPSSDKRQTRSAPNFPGVEVQIPTDLDAVDAVSCLAPWKRDFKSRSKSKAGPFSYLVLDRVDGGSTPALPDHYPIYSPTRSAIEDRIRKTNGRSNSDPFPLPYAFDLVSPDSSDAFAPITVINRPNLFDGILPREIRLRIFGFLVKVYEEDHARKISEGKWTANKASKNKWVGRDRGIRELIRLRRVCRAWSTLIYDGQLWCDLDLCAYPKIPASQLMHLVESAGSFITSFNLAGHRNLLASTLESITSSLSVVNGIAVAPTHNQLTYLNMTGCSMVTTSSLHSLLTQSPLLETSVLKGMPAVTNQTCEILSQHCPRLMSLDMSRCKNLTGAGIRSFASSAVSCAKLLPLIELRLSGLKGITDGIYCRDLHNSSLDAFVSCSEDFSLDSISLTARQAGRNPNDNRRYRRRITRLRHLSLSSCTLLTDIACSHLAYTMPQLVFLELGRVGGDLKNDGIVRLLETLPNLRKLDLEDAIEITDNVLRAITPHPSSDGIKSDLRVPGHALEHLIVSSAVQLSDEAFLALIRNCTRLRVLEADSTRISASTVKEFVTLARERNALDATMVAIDCRSMNEGVVKKLVDLTRPRLGWRAYEARRLAYLDGRDDEALGVGQDECDPRRVVLKTFASWQTVDAVAAVRSKQRKGWRRRDTNISSGSGSSTIEDGLPQRSRWWSPGGRRESGMNSPSLLETNSEREGCTIM
ncbi:hypothetical protein F5888DRAFT_1603440 [Russula emetica]|nr:hypothetical protein F5888DRAFT_1603440 [Russula emetica]